MIRLPASAIILGSSDLKDFETRQRQRRDFDTNGQRSPRLALTVQAVLHPKSGVDPGSRGRKDVSVTDSAASIETADGGYAAPADLIEDQDGRVSTEQNYPPENALAEAQAPQQAKDEFHYNASAEDLVPPTVDDAFQQSSPFVPGDNSTPQHLLPPGARAIRTRTLPRSPLFRSQNASNSPEHRLTSSLAPRLNHLAGVHNTPGILLGGPARRPTRALRHQTNSFSFEDSVRTSTSTAYEPDPVSSISTSAGTHHLPDDLSLKDGLQRSSPGSTRAVSRESSFSVEASEDAETEHSDRDKRLESKESISSHPRLPLPPPFSAVIRSASAAESLPSLSPREARKSSVSSTRDISSGHLVERVASSPLASPPTTGGPEEVALSLHSSSSPGPWASSNSAMRTVSPYRTRSPLSRDAYSPSLSPSLVSRPTLSSGSPRNIYPRTPSRSYQVYNDDLSPAVQPQTPAHLPEARHQSRFHPSYTAPVTRAVGLGIYSAYSDDDTGNDISPLRSRWRATTPSRRTAARSDSPIGLLTEGFRGLYGGRENGDEEQNWVDGVRVSNAEIRLWGLRDARGDGRSLRETPERERWRIGG